MPFECEVNHSRSPLQSEQLCGHCGSARGWPPVQVFRGWSLDAGSKRGELVIAGNPSLKETAAPPTMFSPVRQLQRPRPGWLITPSRWRGRTSKCLTRSGSTRRILQTSQVVSGFKPWENYCDNANHFSVPSLFTNQWWEPSSLCALYPTRSLRPLPNR